jgi:hypothetical protein
MVFLLARSKIGEWGTIYIFIAIRPKAINTPPPPPSLEAKQGSPQVAKLLGPKDDVITQIFNY